jgi:glycosyltransferase 2 family protein
MRIIRIIVALAGSFFFLALAVHDLPTDAVGASLFSADPLWIGTAMLLYAANLSIRARRWQKILRPVAAVPYPAVAKALLVGCGLNAILPARLGEVCRAELLRRSFGLERISALTSIVIERLFDGLMVVGCLAMGLLLVGAATRRNAGALIDVLVTGSVLFGLISLVAFSLAVPLFSRVFAPLPRLSARIMTVQRGFALLRTWRTVEVAVFTLMICVPDALALWCVVKAVGLSLGFANTLVLLGIASLSTLVPSGPAFLGPLQYGYALAIEFAGAPRAVGVAAATIAQLCILLPMALAAIAALIHGSGSAFVAAPEPKLSAAGP